MTLENYENKYGATNIWNDAYVLDIGSSDGFQSAKPHRVPCLYHSVDIALEPPAGCSYKTPTA